MMAERKNVHDPIAEMERMDRFFNGQEEGVKPLNVLRERGIEMPAEKKLDDPALHDVLWKVIEGMAAIGMYLEFTDHLTDRELYRYLLKALKEETILSDDPAAGWHLSPIGGGSEEDNEIWLRYYADEEDRKLWSRERETPLPPRESPLSDRDGRLPGQQAPLDRTH